MTVLATAGHVDHGKSSLVLALTGTDPDRFAEEKRRGLTIDLGFAHTTLPSGADLSFVDVPGHIRFLPNMLAGVGAIAGCVFVVAATEGWKAQSEEHLRILELLGVRWGVIALTKVDLVDDDMVEIARLDIAQHVAGTFLDGAPFVSVSSIDGTGLDELRGALDELVTAAGAAVDDGRPRLWIDRVFAARGSGTVVTGTLAGGRFAVDDRVVVEPGGRPARVRGLQTAGRAVDSIGPGNRVAINLGGVDHGELVRGMAVVEPDRWWLSERLDASLRVLAALDHDVSRRGAYVAYIGAGDHAVQLRVLGGDELAPGADGAVRLHLADRLPLLPGDRFVLREWGRGETIGGGEVLDIAPVLPAAQARPDRALERLVRERGWVTAADVERMTGVVAPATVGEWLTTPDELARVTADIVARVESAGPGGLDLSAFDDRERAVLATLDEVVVDVGRVRPADATDPFADHPYLGELRDGGFAPPQPTDMPRGELRELVRRGHVVERDGVYFHAATIDDAATIAASLLADTDGFTVAAFRDATGTSRKYVLPLLAELDARGITRRRGDLRIPGPRLPPPDPRPR